jgi:hypothetical protein
MAGRLHRAGEEARIEQVQDRVLDAADILVDRQPGIGRLARRSASARGSVKRAKYQDESTKVSIVSVSRRAGLPQAGRRRASRSDGVERVAGLVEGHVLRQHTGRSGVGHRHDAAGVAMDDRDRAAPVALARDAPVAQAEVDLPLPWAPRALAFEPAIAARLASATSAVEEARIDHHASPSSV